MYLTAIERKNFKKSQISFFIFPVKINKFTSIKAPMAHKSNSKEQFKFQFYSFKVSFDGIILDRLALNSLNKALMFVLLSKNFFPIVETNLLFLKNYQIAFTCKERNFFNFDKLK